MSAALGAWKSDEVFRKDAFPDALGSWRLPRIVKRGQEDHSRLAEPQRRRWSILWRCS